MTTANRVTFTSDGTRHTRTIGRRLGRLLRPADVVLLQGPLGAGKTTLTQGIGSGLSVDDPVTSRTFVLLGRHDGETPLYHADLYRLTSTEEVEDLALEEQARDGVLVVEWPERGLTVLPIEHLLVTIGLFEDAPDQRRITVVATGDRYLTVLDGLRIHE